MGMVSPTFAKAWRKWVRQNLLNGAVDKPLGAALEI